MKISFMTPILIHGFVIIFPIFSVMCIIMYIIKGSPRKKIRNKEFTFQPPFPSLKKIAIPRYNSDYPHACGPASMQMLLAKKGITISQEEIAKLNGKKSFGTSSWEIKGLLNKIFSLYNSPYRAKIKFFTSPDMIYQKLQTGEPVLVMFITNFYAKGFGKNAHYPHFGLVTHIENNMVTIQSPAYKRHNGENEHGELIMSTHEFLEKFYAHPRLLKKSELQPTDVRNIFQRLWHRYLNFGFAFYSLAAYHLRVLKPGLSISIEHVDNS